MQPVNGDLLDDTTWSEQLKILVDKHQLQLQPYMLQMTYDDWTMRM